MSNPYLELARKWEAIANKMDKDGVTQMTANTHRLFANELKAVVKLHSKAGLSWDDHMVHGDVASVEEVLGLLKLRHMYKILK
jgi:hypothetical protein